MRTDKRCLLGSDCDATRLLLLLLRSYVAALRLLRSVAAATAAVGVFAAGVAR